MNADAPVRSLTLILTRLGGQARARLIEALPTACRERVLSSIDADDFSDRSTLSPVEQSLALELDLLLGDREPEGDAFREYYALRVADLITIVLLKGTAEAAAQTLVHLPHTVQAESVHAIAAQAWPAAEAHWGADERHLVRDLDALLGGAPREANLQLAVSILRNISNARQLRALLTVIHHRDSEIAKAIQAALFSIEDLRRLSDRELQTLTTGIDDWDLAIAFHGMSEGLKRRILANVSRRRAAQLEDDAVYLEDADEEEVATVCDRILMRARALYEAGQVQTYLGSVSADPIDPDAEDDVDEGPQPRRKKRVPVVEDLPAARSYKAWAFGVAGLAAIATLWFLGVSRSPQSSRSRAQTSVSDFANRQRSEPQDGAMSGTIGQGAPQASGVSASDGDVFVVSGDTRRSIEEAPITYGDVVETGEDGRALITLSQDASKAELGGASALQIGEEDQPVGPPKLSLRVGNVWVEVRNPALEVHSPVLSVTAAEGALYQVRVVLSSATTINVVRGTTWVQSKVGEEDLVVVGEGKSIRVQPRGGIDVVDIEDRGRPRWLIF